MTSKKYPLGPRQAALLSYLAIGADTWGVREASITELACVAGFVDHWGTVHRANCRVAMRTLVERGLIRRLKRGGARGWQSAVWGVTREGRLEARRLGRPREERVKG